MWPAVLKTNTVNKNKKLKYGFFSMDFLAQTFGLFTTCLSMFEVHASYAKLSGYMYFVENLDNTVF